MNKFKLWYTRNYEAITWFLIGFLICGGFNDLGRNDLTGAALLFGIAFVNYLFVKRS